MNEQEHEFDFWKTKPREEQPQRFSQFSLTKKLLIVLLMMFVWFLCYKYISPPGHLIHAGSFHA
ncbi:hypothetical protein F7R25_04140 [Burkholderia stagnalis]|uniref:Uncharacterized protein n=1 Tax=Burkholderia stagnalis TaxID=1503054 RepID=A0A6L3N346_9BURK|nr:hypothetical protein [Burkholderia stagnalis]KAB0640695.1 hypothetical protein F7R25_04140 [Burkholderia stagnalis]VWB06680.1 hypothetical protein BST28156_00136 [Burkholderia stagnalis]